MTHTKPHFFGFFFFIPLRRILGKPYGVKLVFRGKTLFFSTIGISIRGHLAKIFSDKFCTEHTVEGHE